MKAPDLLSQRLRTQHAAGAGLGSHPARGRHALEAAAERYGRFLNMPVRLEA
jgi:hypothetical protein